MGAEEACSVCVIRLVQLLESLIVIRKIERCNIHWDNAVAQNNIFANDMAVLHYEKSVLL